MIVWQRCWRVLMRSQFTEVAHVTTNRGYEMLLDLAKENVRQPGGLAEIHGQIPSL
jgi:hypothetical protein